jgi:hypothetical protein
MAETDLPLLPILDEARPLTGAAQQQDIPMRLVGERADRICAGDDPPRSGAR